jgi:hypothetical protein
MSQLVKTKRHANFKILKILSDLESLRGSSNKKTLYSLLLIFATHNTQNCSIMNYFSADFLMTILEKVNFLRLLVLTLKYDFNLIKQLTRLRQ